MAEGIIHGSSAAALAQALQIDAALGLPSDGTRVGIGIHVPWPDARTTLYTSVRKLASEWSVDIDATIDAIDGAKVWQSSVLTTLDISGTKVTLPGGWSAAVDVARTPDTMPSTCWAVVGQSNAGMRADSTDNADYASTVQAARSYYRVLNGAGTPLHSQLEWLPISPSGTNFGIERSFVEDYGLTNVVTFSQGSTRLDTDWQTDGKSYQPCIEVIDAALDRLGLTDLTGMIWYQGESDANNAAAAAAYASNLTTLMADFRARWGPFDLVVPYLHTDNPRNHASTVRTQAESYVSGDARAAGVDPDALTTADGIHYATAEYISLGQLCATAAGTL